jgi:hypothetical protein
MLQMLNDEDSADVVFAVGKQQSKDNAKKVAKIAPVTLHAHSLMILTACSAVLAELCESKGDPSTLIEITDKSPEVFRHLLYYIYGGKISDDDKKSHAKEIINAANRYGVATLKLEAEAFLVGGQLFIWNEITSSKHYIYLVSLTYNLFWLVTFVQVKSKQSCMLDSICCSLKVHLFGQIQINDCWGSITSWCTIAIKTTNITTNTFINSFHFLQLFQQDLKRIVLHRCNPIQVKPFESGQFAAHLFFSFQLSLRVPLVPLYKEYPW